MTLTEMLKLAREIDDEHKPVARNEMSKTFARAFIELFEAEPPCMMEPPTWSNCDDKPEIYTEEMRCLSTDDARAYAKLILVACDEANASVGSK